jgi:glycosyltransferase involved in cell wall biosynthesis
MEMRGRIVGRAFRSWETFLLNRNYSRTLFLTDDNRDAALRLCKRKNHLMVNHPGISTSEFAPADHKENMVVFVGKFDVRKGVHDVLEVARALPKIPFLMIGWGTLEEELKSKASANVSFARIEDRDGLRRSLARATCFFLPSQGEGFPVAILEAMASGCAVVSTVPVSFAGVRVAPGDRNAMTAAIQRLWENPDEAIRLGARNRDLASSFSWEAHAIKLISIYREVLSERER